MKLLLDSHSVAQVTQHPASEPHERHESNVVELEHAEALRCAVRAATAVREAAQRALKRRRHPVERSVDQEEVLAQALTQEESALRRYAQYLSEASDLSVHLRPR